MSGQEFKVPPMSWDRVEAVALRLRKSLGMEDTPHFPIMNALERVMDHRLEGFHLLVGPRHEMGGAEGYTDPNGEYIMLREDVYEAAWDGDGRARFTAAHELGHWALHTNTPLERAEPSEDIKPYRLSEPQANQFAAGLLMPARFFQRSDSPKQVMERHGVSSEAARHRLSYLRSKGRLP